MIIVTGGATVRADCLAEAFAEAKLHVARSRKEDGCIHHSVHIDADDPLRLFFYEEWRDMAALRQHFAVSDSVAFVTALHTMSERIDPIRIFEAEAIS